MEINIWHYVNRWQNEYIIYHPEHFINGYPRQERHDLSRAVTLFTNQYTQNVAKMHQDALDSQMEAMNQNIRNSSGEAIAGLRLVDSLQRGDLLEKTMDVIAETFNQYSDKAFRQTFDTILQNSRKYNYMLQVDKNVGVDNQKLTEFFNLIIQGLNMAGGLSQRQLGMLLDQMGQLSGTTFELPHSTGAIAIKPKDMEVAEKVVTYLRRAAQKFRAGGGTLDGGSFSSTVNNIFSTAIGEEVSRNMMAQAADLITSKADTIVANMKIPGGGQLIIENPGQWNLTGQSRAKNPNGNGTVVSKVDIHNDGTYVIRFGIGQYTWEVEMGLNTSVKWAKGSSSMPPEVKVVNQTPLSKYFPPKSEERYLMYNIIAHRFEGPEFHSAYRVARASTAAKFFNDWMTGTGGANMQGFGTNKVQYLMVNGKLYSVMRIIRNICNELMERAPTEESMNMPINMTVSKAKDVKGTWLGEPDVPNPTLALSRSNTYVNGVLNKLVIGATLNSNILLKYCY